VKEIKKKKLIAIKPCHLSIVMYFLLTIAISPYINLVLIKSVVFPSHNLMEFSVIQYKVVDNLMGYCRFSILMTDLCSS
jgi:hypothetical protein